MWVIIKCEVIRMQLFSRLGTQEDDVAIADVPVRHLDARRSRGRQTSGLESILLLHHSNPTSHSVVYE
jgi:hypothetical protein